MTLLTEQPLRLALVCLAVIVAVGAVYVQTRRPAAAKALGGVVVMSLLLILVERLVETDVEAIHALLYEMADDIAHNDRKALLEHVSPSADDLRRSIEGVMPTLHFEEAKITTTPDVRVVSSADPPAATATFRARVSASTAMTPEATAIPFVDVHLLKEATGWQVLNYTILATNPGLEPEGAP